MELLNPFVTLTLVSVALSLAISVIYRVLTKPHEMKKIKDDMKFYKQKSTEAQKKGDKEAAAKYASEMLKASQSQFRFTMKPMMATMLLFFLLLGWLHANYGGVTADFAADPEAAFAYDGSSLALSYDAPEDGAEGDPAFTAGVDLDDDGQFSDGETFAPGDVFEYGGAYWRVGSLMEGFLVFQSPRPDAVHFEMLVARMPFSLPFIGEYLSWFWWYIFISIPGTIIFRKLLGVE
jgi:uncharacterized membrane protein (DUF106 family)